MQSVLPKATHLLAFAWQGLWRRTRDALGAVDTLSPKALTADARHMNGCRTFGATHTAHGSNALPTRCRAARLV